MKTGKLFVISAPSGTGKTTVVHLFLSRYGKQYQMQRVVTYTSRMPRKGEIEGIDYYFVTVQQFKDLIEKDFFLEWTCWCDHYYGSPQSIIADIKTGKSFFLIIDRMGAKRVYKAYSQAILIWLMPPSLQELEHRLIMRGTGTASVIKDRLIKAEAEIKEEEYDKQHANYPLYQYHLVNNNLEDTVKQLVVLVDQNLKL